MSIQSNDQADTAAPAHLTPTVSDRGFTHLPPIADEYGTTVRVYESSAAMAPHIWLRTQESVSREGVSVHLGIDDAAKLAEQIQFVVANHYQLRDDTDGGMS